MSLLDNTIIYNVVLVSTAILALKIRKAAENVNEEMKKTAAKLKSTFNTEIRNDKPGFSKNFM